MELTRCYVIRIWTIWMVVAFVVNQVEPSAEKCKPIPIQDIQDAAIFSMSIYKGNFIKGMGVPRVPGYVIKKVISKTLSKRGMDIRGEPLKILIAEKLHEPPTVLICFMGTKSAEQLYEQAKAGGFKQREVVRFGGKEVKVMKYFWEAFQELISVTDAVVPNKGIKYIVTGHSLGGALASLYSIYMTDKHNGDMWKNPDSSLITFGQPRVGDSDYAGLHDFLIQPFRKPRIVLNKDVVPHIPFRTSPAQSYQHTSREVWIEMKGTAPVWHVCPNGDGNKCSNGVWSIKYKLVADHKMDKYVHEVVSLRANKKDLAKLEAAWC